MNLALELFKDNFQIPYSLIYWDEELQQFEPLPKLKDDESIQKIADEYQNLFLGFSKGFDFTIRAKYRDHVGKAAFMWMRKTCVELDIVEKDEDSMITIAGSLTHWINMKR